jgi:hypothetical protein
MTPDRDNPAIPPAEKFVAEIIASGAGPDDVIGANVGNVAEGRPTSAPGRTHALCHEPT